MNFKSTCLVIALLIVAVSATNTAASASNSKPAPTPAAAVPTPTATAGSTVDFKEVLANAQRDLRASIVQLKTAADQTTADLSSNIKDVSDRLGVLIKRFDKLEQKVKDIANVEEIVRVNTINTNNMKKEVQSFESTIAQIIEQQEALVKKIENQAAASPLFKDISEKVSVYVDKAKVVAKKVYGIIRVYGGVYIDKSLVILEKTKDIVQKKIAENRYLRKENFTPKAIQEAAFNLYIKGRQQYELLQISGTSQALKMGVPLKYAPMLVQSLLLIAGIITASLAVLLLLTILRIIFSIFLYFLCCRFCRRSSTTKPTPIRR